MFLSLIGKKKKEGAEPSQGLFYAVQCILGFQKIKNDYVGKKASGFTSRTELKTSDTNLRLHPSHVKFLKYGKSKEWAIKNAMFLK